MPDREWVCHSCGQPKLALEPQKSKVTGMEMLICKTCKQEGHEPRAFLIIAYRGSSEKIRKVAAQYIRDNKYTGDRILLEEFL